MGEINKEKLCKEASLLLTKIEKILSYIIESIKRNKRNKWSGR